MDEMDGQFGLFNGSIDRRFQYFKIAQSPSHFQAPCCGPTVITAAQ